MEQVAGLTVPLAAQNEARSSLAAAEDELQHLRAQVDQLAGSLRHAEGQLLPLQAQLEEREAARAKLTAELNDLRAAIGALFNPLCRAPTETRIEADRKTLADKSAELSGSSEVCPSCLILHTRMVTVCAASAQG